MAEPSLRFLTFRTNHQLYALPAEDVAEVIRIPAIAKVPQSPVGLLGLANLRGAVVPITSLSGLLGHSAAEMNSTSRAIVLRGAAPVAVAVDMVDALVEVDAWRIQPRRAHHSSEIDEDAVAAFQQTDDGETTRVLDINTLLSSALTLGPRAIQPAPSVPPDHTEEAVGTDDDVKLVTFEIAGQQFAMNLDTVQEIMAPPEDVAPALHSETLVIGVAAHRGGLLPLLSLRGLLGFPERTDLQGKVLVVHVADILVGIVVDRIGAILRADPNRIDATPRLLAARTGGESQISAIYRSQDGHRLISILSPEQLFRDEVMERLGKAGDVLTEAVDEETQAGEYQRFLVFRLGDDEFGLPIAAVDEVTTAPTRMTHVPNSPDFLEGVINLRGQVVPILDQRKRFDLPPLADPAKRRLLVVHTDRLRAGLIVDSVSDVLAIDGGEIQPAPQITGERGRLVEGVVNLEADRRMVLLLDPSELLTRAELSLIDAFKARGDHS